MLCEFNENLTKIMTDRKITNKALSEWITDNYKKISKETIAKYRDGSRTPSPEFIAIIAEYFDIPEQYLFDTSDKKKQKILKDILKNPSQETQRLIDLYCSTQKNFNNLGTIVDGDENSITTNSHNTTPQEPLNHRAMTLLEIFNEKSEQEQRDILKMVLSL